ncbi:MAG TPA: hypothetical protein VK848_12135, partial [Acidimicrobiia bacterium]|nr:hypothetical protein [Acidimicrobiia bacterium]
MVGDGRRQRFSSAGTGFTDDQRAEAAAHAAALPKADGPPAAAGAGHGPATSSAGRVDGPLPPTGSWTEL